MPPHRKLGSIKSAVWDYNRKMTAAVTDGDTAAVIGIPKPVAGAKRPKPDGWDRISRKQRQYWKTQIRGSKGTIGSLERNE